MATYTELQIEDRIKTGASASRSIRREGKIPAVFYFHGVENQNLTLDRKQFHRAIHSGSHIYEMNLSGKKQHVMIKSVQYHPVTEEIIHVDLLGVHMTEKISISVPIVLEGEAIGVEEGGVLMQNITALDILCLPTDVPENVTLEISDLDINSHLDVKDIQISAGIEVTTPEDTTVVTIQPPQVEVEPEIPEGEEEELEEGEVPEGEEVEGEEVEAGKEGEAESSEKDKEAQKES